MAIVHIPMRPEVYTVIQENEVSNLTTPQLRSLYEQLKDHPEPLKVSFMVSEDGVGNTGDRKPETIKFLTDMYRLYLMNFFIKYGLPKDFFQNLEKDCVMVKFGGRRHYFDIDNLSILRIFDEHYRSTDYPGTDVAAFNIASTPLTLMCRNEQWELQTVTVANRFGTELLRTWREFCQTYINSFNMTSEYLFKAALNTKQDIANLWQGLFETSNWTGLVSVIKPY